MYANLSNQPAFLRTPHFCFNFKSGDYSQEHPELVALVAEGHLSHVADTYPVDHPTAQEATVIIMERGYTP